MGKGIWGIDISKYSIKAVRMEASVDGLAITAADVFPYSEERTGEPGDFDEQIRTTLEEAKAQLKIGRERVVLSLPSHSTFNRLVKLPPVDDNKIAEVLRYEAAQQIPFPIDEVIWDFQFVEREYGPGEEKEVVLFAIKRDIVEQFLKGIEDVGLNVEAVQFSPVALYNFLVHDQDVKSTSVAIDMGGDNTDLVVIDGPKFWIRNLPLTGDDITKALQKAFSIPFNEAESLKLKAAQSPQAQKIFNAIQPVLRDLVGEVQRSIGYYKSISKTVKFDKVILLGNSTKTFNFQRFVSQSLQLPAARVSKLNHIQLGGSVDQAQFNEDVGTLGTAIGLALQGHGQSKNRINLLPPVYVKRKELKKKQPYIIGIVAALYMLAFSVWKTWDGEAKALNNVSANARKAITTAEKLHKDYAAARNLGGLDEQLDRTASISYERDLILKVMNDITVNVPKNGQPGLNDGDRIWILDWSFREKPLAASGAAQPASADSRSYITEKKLEVTLEVAVRKENRAARQVEDMIKNALLGVDPNGQPSPGAKASVVTNFKLREGDKESGMFFEVKPLNESDVHGESGSLLDPSDSSLDDYLRDRRGRKDGEPKKEWKNKEWDKQPEQDIDRNDSFFRFEIKLEIPLRPEKREAIRKPKEPEQPAEKPKPPSGRGK